MVGHREHCKYCGSGQAVPVLDKRIEKSPKPGNKYRAACKSCGRWLPLSSEDEFRSHPNPHVLPADADADEIDRLIPLEDYDYGPEWEELVESETDQQIEADQQTETDQRAVATDGGVDQDAGDDRDDVQDDVDEEPENEFECPATGCETVNSGKPDKCAGCGAAYKW